MAAAGWRQKGQQRKRQGREQERAWGYFPRKRPRPERLARSACRLAASAVFRTHQTGNINTFPRLLVTPAQGCNPKNIRTMTPSRSTAQTGHALIASRLARLGLTAPLALLVACSSVPLPTWTPTFFQPAAGAAPAPAPAPTSASAQISLVKPPPATGQSTPAKTPAAPYSAAVAARFSAPSVTYSTPGLQAGRTSFTTQDEISQWLHAQVDSLSHSVGVNAAIVSIGQSQQGQNLEALVLTRVAGTGPATLRASGRPTVLLIGQQNGDEPASSEALLVIARELAQGLLQPVLEQINVVIVPCANPDGAARQQRATAGGLDLSRDHLLLHTPEAQALASLTRDYQPTVVLDAQEYAVQSRYLNKFGALQKSDVQFHYATSANLPEFLTKAAEEWYRSPLLAALKGQGLSSEWSYTTSADLADKKLVMNATPPDLSPNTDGLKNIVSLQIESRGAGLGQLDIQRRVHAQVTAMTSVLGSTAQRAKELGQLRPYLDKEVSAQACQGQAVIEAAPTPAQYDLVMLDPASGADKTITVDWDSTLALRPLKTRVRPCGYWLSASSKTAAERLGLQGLQVQQVLAQTSLLGDTYHETAQTGSSTASSDTGVTLVPSVIDAPAGSYYISLSQPLANLAIAALEPDTPASYFSNQLIDDLSSIARVMSPPSLQTEVLP